MPKAKEAPPAKEISEENRRLAEEFERQVDEKVGDLGEDDTFDVLPVEEGVVQRASLDSYIVDITVGKGVTPSDISTSVKDRILTVNVRTTVEDGVCQEIGKLLSLPLNVDLTALSSQLTGEGTLRIQAPYIQPGGGAAANPNDAPALATELHNKYRKIHGAGPITLNPELSKVAETAAKALLKGSEIKVDEMSLGQNVFEIPNTSVPAPDAVQQAVTSWYNSNKDYNFQDPISSPKPALSFSQVVWKSSVILGIAVERSQDKTLVLALYSKAGNVPDNKSHGENVSPAQ